MKKCKITMGKDKKLPPWNEWEDVSSEEEEVIIKSKIAEIVKSIEICKK